MHQRANTKGFSLVEVMVASAIFLVIVVSIGHFVTQSRSSSIRIEASGQCRQVVETVIQSLKVMDNTTVITNHIPSPRTQLPTGLGAARLPWAFVDGAGAFTNFQNIQSTSTILQQMYRANPAACISGTGVNAASVLSATIPSGYTAMVKVAGHELISADPSTDCADIYRARPNSGWGVDLIIEVTHEIPNSTTNETCRGMATVGYERDTIAPTITLDANPVYGAEAGVYTNVAPRVRQPGQPEAAGSVTNTLCGYTSGAVMDVRIPLLSNEPGSLFKCAAVVATGGTPPVPADNAFSYCDGFNLLALGVSGVLTLDGADAASTLAKPTRTRAHLTFTGVPEGKYRFYVKSVDTAQNESPAALVFFTVDTLRPVWTSANPILSADTTNRAVGAAILPPLGSIYAANDAHAQTFNGNDPQTGLPILYQCSPTSDPAFVGTMSSQMGNESCTGVTNQGQTATPNLITGNQCRLELNHTPIYQVGRLTLTGELRDICNPSPDAVPAAAIATATWINDLPGGDPISATHTLSGGTTIVPSNFYAPISRPKGGAVDPRWNVVVTRSQPDLLSLPVGVEFPRLTTGAPPQDTNSLRRLTQAQNPSNSVTGLPATDFFLGGQTGSCRYDQGFCARAYTACGGYVGSSGGVASPFAIRGGNADSCWEVPCQAGLQCSLNVADRGRCKAQSNFNCASQSKWKCTNHSDCDSAAGVECMQVGTSNPMPWGNTTFNAGECIANITRICGSDTDCVTSDGFQGRCFNQRCSCHDSAAIGSQGAGGNRDPKCANGSDYFGAICGGAVPICTCDAASANHCVTESFPNSCGVPNACRGTFTDQAHCGAPTSNLALTVNCPSPVPWLGVPPPAPNNQYIPQVSGGFAPYTYQCSLDNSTWLADCRYSSWPETPGANVWFRVTDARGDYAFSPVCTYKHDKTPPALTAIISDCGTLAKPTLSLQVPLTLTLSDNLSNITVTARNMSRALAQNICGPVPNTGVGCTSINAPALGLAADSSAQDINVTATDEANNQTTVTLGVYSPVGTGFTHSVNPGGGATFTQSGFSSGASSPYNQKLTSQFAGTNSLNYYATQSVVVVGSTLAGTRPAAQWPAGTRSDVDFNNDGIQNMSVTFRDGCGVTSSTVTTPVRLDWTSPQNISHVCDNNSQSIDFSANDSESGVFRVKGTCSTENEGTRSIAWTNGSSATITNIGVGTSHCVLDAIDRAGNATDDNDGYNVQRSVNATCIITVATPTPTPSATPSSCIPNGMDCQETTFKCSHNGVNPLGELGVDHCGDCCSGTHHFTCAIGTQPDCNLCVQGGTKTCGPGGGGPGPTPTATPPPATPPPASTTPCGSSARGYCFDATEHCLTPAGCCELFTDVSSKGLCCDGTVDANNDCIPDPSDPSSTGNTYPPN